MAKNQNTFAKQQREMEKKRKAEQKRLRKSQRKAAGVEGETDTDSERTLTADEQNAALWE
jgi:hypothetical protein